MFFDSKKTPKNRKNQNKHELPTPDRRARQYDRTDFKKKDGESRSLWRTRIEQSDQIFRRIDRRRRIVLGPNR